jgi:cytochrome c oxidase subunit 3
MNNYFSKTFIRLLFTIMLGVYFLAMQALEYDEAQFSIADGVYGSVFFMATGFHGMHVLIGTLFLTYVLFNLVNIKLTWQHHFRFEAAAWY